MASMNDKFGRASSPTGYADTTTVRAPRLSGETTLAAYDLSGYDDETPLYFVTYKKTTVVDPDTGVAHEELVNQTSWKGLVDLDNNTITQLEVAEGYTDVGNETGDYIEPVPTSFWANDLVDGILKHANPDGTDRNLPVYAREIIGDGVLKSTGEITTVSGRTASISDIIYYMGGIRLTKTAIPNKTFTASRDTYCYIDASGNVTYVEAANHAGAASGAPANSILFAIVITNASTITRVYHHNFDSSRVPHLFELTSTSNSGGAGAYAGIAGMTDTVIIPETREYLVELNIPTIYASNTSTQYNFRVQFNSSIILATASHAPSALAGNPTNFTMKRKVTLQRGVYQQSAQWFSVVAGTNSLSMGGAATMPVTVTVTAV